jgi:hypothetical protein
MEIYIWWESGGGVGYQAGYLMVLIGDQAELVFSRGLSKAGI